MNNAITQQITNLTLASLATTLPALSETINSEFLNYPH